MSIVRVAIGAYLAALHLVVALPHIEPHVALPQTPPTTSTARTPKPQPGHFAWQDPQVPDGATVFLGDSITAGLLTSNLAPRTVNYGISGATTADVLNVIDKLPSVKRASRIYLAVGVNDVHDGLPGTEDRFRAIATAIPAGTSVVWSAVLPTAHPRISVEAVQRVNEEARAACAARSRCTWVPAPEWREGYLLADGVHLSGAGYAAWAAALRR